MSTADHLDDTLHQGEPLDADDAWPVHTRRGGIRMQIPTAILVALLIAAAGLWGGSFLQKRNGTTAAAGNGTAASRFAAFRNAAGAGGLGFARPGGAGSTGAAPTFGTVTGVQGNILYLTSASGALVKVKLSPKTTITRNAKTTKTGLKLGDTAIVTGTAGTGGIVTATAVASTAKGVTTGFGRLGGGGGGGGGFGAGGGTGSGG